MHGSDPISMEMVRSFWPWILILGYGCILFRGFHDTRVFNYHDDMEKYLRYPEQLLRSGNLRTGLWDSTGLETLGGQAFFQSLFRIFTGISFVPVFDSVVCQLSLLMWVSFQSRDFLWILLLMLLIMAIDPLYVNVSSIYSGAIALGLLMYGCCRCFEQDRIEQRAGVLTMSMGISLAVALKITLAIVIPIYFVFFLLYFFISFGFRKCIWLGLQIIGISCLFALPWFLIQAQKYVRMLSICEYPQENVGIEYLEILNLQKIGRLFDLDPLFYGFGCSVGCYTYFVVLLVFCTVIFSILQKRKRVPNFMGYWVSIAGFVSSYFLLMIGLGASVGQEQCIRYLVPDFMAICVPISLLTKTRDFVIVSSRKMSQLSYCFVLCLVCVSAIFVPSFSKRTMQALWGRPLNSVPGFGSQHYQKISEYLIGNDRGCYLRSIQELIPENEGIMLWCIGSFHFDYRRNPFTNIEAAALTAPWMLLPDEPGGSTFNDTLEDMHANGVRYVIWQYDGFGVREYSENPQILNSHDRRSQKAGFKFCQFLTALPVCGAAEILYEDKEFRVMKLKDHAG